MKRIIFTTIIVLIITASLSKIFAQSCCTKQNSATETFALLGENESFVSAHEAPLPFTFTEGTGKQISFKTSSGKDANAYEIKAIKPTNKYLFVIHEWWGLNDYIKQEAEKFQKELGDVNVVALDLYDGKVATTADDAGKYMQSVTSERATSIIRGALSYVGENAKITTIGWCFGGGWSLQASLLADGQAVGCIMYYGMPEKDNAKLKILNADVLGIFATKDKWINPEVVLGFEKNMKTSGKNLTVKNFDADHAFANPSNPHFNKVYAEEAHMMALEFLKEHLK